MTTLTTKIPLGARRKDPFIFRQFFEMGQEESASPFLNARAQRISRNFSFKTSLFSAFLLLASYIFAGSFISEILLISVYLIAGVPSLIDSVEDVLFRGDVNIDVLMTIAAFSAYFLGAGFEGALLLVLFAISGSLEMLVTLKAKNALSLAQSIAPTKAYLIDDDNQAVERAVEDIDVGEHIFVRAGEVVPLDGIVIKGESSVQLAHLTGENQPLRKKEGDEVTAGAVLMEGALTIQVTHISADSTIARIIQLITKAQEARPKLEQWFDKFGRRYALSIITISLGFALFATYFLDIPFLGKEGSIYRALAFLITASPCALILAVPIAYLSALGACAKKGIILKGGVVLDALNQCTLIAFDKTGTLTLGELRLKEIEKLTPDGLSKEMALRIGASLERNATHPIAKAITAAADELVLFPVKNVKVIPGYGVEGVVHVDGQDVQAFVGDVKRAPEVEKIALEKRAVGDILAVLIVENKSYLFSFEDSIRKTIPEMLQKLKEDGRKVIMLTGDHKESAAHIAKIAGITEYYASLKPEDKLEKIEMLSRSYGLAMCGDGINDAPALARATVGIAMGKMGSATAREAADCVLLHDRIDLLDWLFQKAEKTRRIVRQNLTIAMGAILLASIPALYGVVPLWLAVILHEGGTVLVGLNAIRLLRE